MVLTRALQTPPVSIVIPCRNEESCIESVLTRFYEQDYDGTLEIIIVDGESTDDTLDKVRDFYAKYPKNPIEIIDNNRRDIPTGLNLGINRARGEIIIRMDGHALPGKDYVRIAVQTLTSNNYDVVGGICISAPGTETATAKAIALGISHIFGVGDSRFRLANSPQKGRLVDTVPFGCFRKSLWQNLGGFDENLLTNEDYDFNYRVQKNGGTVFLNPALVTKYIARATLPELARQYFRYGRWKLKMLLKEPMSIKLRHIIPPTFLLAFVISGLLSFVSNAALIVFALITFTYLLTNVVATAHASFCTGSGRLFPLLMVVFVTMHFSWGGGVLYSFFKHIFRERGIPQKHAEAY